MVRFIAQTRNSEARKSREPEDSAIADMNEGHQDWMGRSEKGSLMDSEPASTSSFISCCYRVGSHKVFARIPSACRRRRGILIVIARGEGLSCAAQLTLL